MLRLIPIALICCSFSLASHAVSIWDYFLPTDQLSEMTRRVEREGIRFSPIDVLLTQNKANYQIDSLTRFLDENHDLDLNELFKGRHLVADMLWLERHDLAKLLIDRGSNPNFLNGNGNGSLHDAINSDDLSSVRFLLALDQVNVNLFSEGIAGKRTPLMLAIAGGNMDIFNEILSHRFLNVNLQGTAGFSALHIAVSHGAKDMVNSLVQTRNLNLDIRCAHGVTPLHTAVLVAVSKGGPNVSTQTRLEIASILYFAGANHLAQADNGSTPLQMARQFQLAPFIYVFTQLPRDQVLSVLRALGALPDGQSGV